MRKKFCFGVLCTAFSAVSVFTLNLCSTPPVFSGEEVEAVAETYLSEGDMRLFGGDMQEARKMYEFVLKEDPENYEALWRLTRFYISRGMAAEKTKDKIKEWQEARIYGERAVGLRPEGAEGHLYLAVSMGKLALFSPASEKVKFVRDIKEEAERAIELDPEEQKGYLALGAWHRNVATASTLEKQLAKMFFGELPEGSLEESLKLLEKSRELGGADVRNFYELAMTYEALGDYESAKTEFEKAVESRSVYPEDDELKERVRKELGRSRYN